MAAVAGVDWAGDKHDSMVQDADGAVTWEGTVAHGEAGIARLREVLCSHVVMRVAIERPDGLLVERLLDAGLVVLSLHPRFRALTPDTDNQPGHHRAPQRHLAVHDTADTQIATLPADLQPHPMVGASRPHLTDVQPRQAGVCHPQGGPPAPSAQRGTDTGRVATHTTPTRHTNTSG